MKWNKKAAIRWTLLAVATLLLVYFASALFWGRVRARYRFNDEQRRFTVTVRELPNEGWPIDGLAWLGFRPGKHTYWAELHSGFRLVARSPRATGDTYYARQVEIRSANTTGATVSLGNQNGGVEWHWIYSP